MKIMTLGLLVIIIGVTGCSKKEDAAKSSSNAEETTVVVEETEESVEKTQTESFKGEAKSYNETLLKYGEYDGAEASDYADKVIKDIRLKFNKGNGLDGIPENFKKPLTKLEYAKLTRTFIEDIMMLELTAPEVSVFEDTSDEDVLKVYNAGIIGGSDRRSFGPNEFITREEVANMAMRTIQWICVEYNMDYKQIVSVGVQQLPLNDYMEVSAAYDLEVRSAFANGIMTGATDKLFIPKGFIKREDAIVVVGNMYNALVEE